MSNTGGKVAIVTGASSGIGKATAVELLRRGYRVHAAARRVGAMSDLAALGARVHHLDLTDGASIDDFMNEVLREGDRVDLLVNNAGYGSYGAVEEVPLAVARAQMEVNVFGLARLVQLTVPSMRRRRSGRIVNVSSIGGKLWSVLGAWYHASKFAVEGFSDCLRNELRPFGIDVIVVEPGGVKTEWGGIAIESMQRASGHGPYAPIVEGAASLFTSDIGFATAEQIANVICRAATVRRPRARYVAPLSATIMLWLRWLLPDAAFDWVAGRLFRIPARLHAASVAPSGSPGL